MKRIAWMLTLLLAAGVLLAAGCGDDDDDDGGSSESTPAATEDSGGGGGGGGESLTVTADPGGAISWQPTDLNAQAGDVTIELVNESSTPHAIEVEGNGVEEESDTVTGGNATLNVNLKPGEYEFYCPVGNHRDQGMEGTLTVQ
jgi:plastocyanin